MEEEEKKVKMRLLIVRKTKRKEYKTRRSLPYLAVLRLSRGLSQRAGNIPTK
jgi:hypothetical protein